jgi:UDP-N-acetylmuramoylalanine--D-glutamate ligase
MVSSDHLDWHGSQEAYVNAKRNIVRFQPEDGIAVLNEENDLASSFAEYTKAKLVRFGLKGRRPFELAIAGSHNQLNAQAAFFTAYLCGVTWEQAQGAIKDFRGLTHRLQLIHESAGVRFINDSIATIPEAAVAALKSFPPKTVIQIVGGSKKKDPPIEELCATLGERAKAVLCIGETGPKIAACVPGSIISGTLAQAIATAKSIAVDGDIVLLSPGYASYDQFVNFEQRGDEFARLCELSS